MSGYGLTCGPTGPEPDYPPICTVCGRDDCLCLPSAYDALDDPVLRAQEAEIVSGLVGYDPEDAVVGHERLVRGL